MASLAKTQLDVPLPLVDASERLVPVLIDAGFTLDQASHPGASELVFDAKRKKLRNALRGFALLVENGPGTTIELGLDTAPGESTALLDGRRNRATLQELTDQVAASLR